MFRVVGFNVQSCRGLRGFQGLDDVGFRVLGLDDVGFRVQGLIWFSVEGCRVQGFDVWCGGKREKEKKEIKKEKWGRKEIKD